MHLPGASAEAVDRARVPRPAPVSALAADRRLELLSRDDALRAQFQHGPHRAMEAAWFDAATLQPLAFDWFYDIALAREATIAGAHEATRAMLLRGLAQATPTLDTGSDRSRRARVWLQADVTGKRSPPPRSLPVRGNRRQRTGAGGRQPRPTRSAHRGPIRDGCRASMARLDSPRRPFGPHKGMGMSTKTLTAPLDPRIADRLLDLLSTDDLFRERFQRDHLAALRSIGYQSPPPRQLTACGLSVGSAPEPFAECKVHELASKEAILGARKAIQDMLLEGLAHTTPQLDAALPGERVSLRRA